MKLIGMKDKNPHIICSFLYYSQIVVEKLNKKWYH